MADAPTCPCISNPPSKAQDDNNNFEFVVEVRGRSEAQKHSPKFIPTVQGRQRRGQEKDLSLPVWLGLGGLESYSHFPGLRVRCHRRGGNYS